MKTIFVKNINNVSIRNIKVLALSLLYAHLWYDEVELYTDELGYNIFKDFPIKVIKYNFNGYKEVLKVQKREFLFINYDFIGVKPLNFRNIQNDYVVNVRGKGTSVNYIYVKNVIGFSNIRTYNKINKVRNDFDNLKGFNNIENSILSKYLTINGIDIILKECFNYWGIVLKKRIKLFYE